jgi:ubiquinone biosynthesis protein UbiJ
MWNKPPLAVLNHILTGEDWARARLAGFAGQTAEVYFANLLFQFTILESGLLAVAETSAAVAVSIRLPDDAPLRALTDRSSLFSAVTISGSVDLAEALAFVFRNLRWDVEQDLSELLGDIVARRAMRLATGLAQWQLRGAKNLAFGLAEYLTEEEKAIAPRRELEAFCTEVDALRDDFARIEKRLGRIELRWREPRRDSLS